MRMPDVYMSLLLAFGVAGAKAEAVDFVQGDVRVKWWGFAGGVVLGLLGTTLMFFRPFGGFVKKNTADLGQSIRPGRIAI